MVDLRDYELFVDVLADMDPDELEHHGIKGMHWGVRKERVKQLKGLGPDRIVRKTKRGDTITLEKNPPPALARLFARFSDKSIKAYNNNAFFTIKDSAGKRIGDGTVRKVSKDEINLVWLGIDKRARGKGYATTVMRAAQEYGRATGASKLTLEVPGNSPDARHIYEKLGFKVTKEAIDPKELVWGGLTEMEYRFPRKLAHSVSYSVDDFLASYGKLRLDDIL